MPLFFEEWSFLEYKLHKSDTQVSSLHPLGNVQEVESGKITYGVESVGKSKVGDLDIQSALTNLSMSEYTRKDGEEERALDQASGFALLVSLALKACSNVIKHCGKTPKNPKHTPNLLICPIRVVASHKTLSR